LMHTLGHAQCKGGRRLGRCFSSSVHSLPALTNQVFSRFPPRVLGLRTIGREAEFAVVSPDGHSGDVQAVLRALKEQLPHLRAETFSDATATPGLLSLIGELNGPCTGVVEFTIELGTGTVEIVGSPSRDLHHVARQFETAVDHLAAAALQAGQQVLGFGIQPLTPASETLLSTRARNTEQMRDAAWIHYTTTASDQVHPPSPQASSTYTHLLAHTRTSTHLHNTSRPPLRCTSQWAVTRWSEC
jgi:hypothetical protein